MKLNVQFANGEEREYEDANASDFNVTVGKILLKKVLLLGDEAYNTDMIVKITRVDE